MVGAERRLAPEPVIIIARAVHVMNERLAAGRSVAAATAAGWAPVAPARASMEDMPNVSRAVRATVETSAHRCHTRLVYFGSRSTTLSWLREVISSLENTLRRWYAT